jgi:hypothetical protein
VPTGAGRDVDPRRPRDLHEVALDLALEVVPALLVGEVPLVVGDDQGPPGVDDLLDDPHVLLGDRLGGVDEHHRDLGLLQRRLGAQGGVEVGATRLVDPAADAGGVDEAPVAPADLTSSSTGSRVVPATSSTTTRWWPTSLLSREDLPTLGRPTRATRRGPPRS